MYCHNARRVWTYQKGQSEAEYLPYRTQMNINNIRRVWRYQRGKHNPYIEEEQRTQWPKKKYKRTNTDVHNIHI
jgi:hypothetical protein